MTQLNLSGLLFINDVDVWQRFGAFLYEENAQDQRNYSALLRPSTAKPLKAVAYPEEDGERLPQGITPRLEPRDVTLTLGILAPRAQFIERYTALLAFLREGWLVLSLPELSTSFRMHYLGASDYKQLTAPTDDLVGATLSIKLREPQPQY